MLITSVKMRYLDSCETVYATGTCEKRSGSATCTRWPRLAICLAKANRRALTALSSDNTPRPGFHSPGFSSTNSSLNFRCSQPDTGSYQHAMRSQLSIEQVSS